MARGGRGLLPAFGLSAVGIGQALVVRTATPPGLLLLVLGLWLPAVSVGLALHDAANRDAAAPLAQAGSHRRWRPGAVDPSGAMAIPSATARAVRSALVASVVVALLAAAAAAFLHPPGDREARFGRRRALLGALRPHGARRRPAWASTRPATSWTWAGGSS